MLRSTVFLEHVKRNVIHFNGLDIENIDEKQVSVCRKGNNGD